LESLESRYNDVVMTRLESHFFTEWLHSPQGTINDSRLGSESYFQNLQYCIDKSN